MEAVSLLGKYMSKYGGFMFITKQEALEMDIQSLSLWELELYKSRAYEFTTKSRTRKFEKDILNSKIRETIFFIGDIYEEKCGFMHNDI